MGRLHGLGAGEGGTVRRLYLRTAAVVSAPPMTATPRIDRIELFPLHVPFRQVVRDATGPAVVWEQGRHA